MKCSKCGQEIDVPGKFCPHCGAPIDEPAQPQKKQRKAKKPFYKRWWFWAIVVILLLASCGGTSDSTEKAAPATEAATTAAPTEASTGSSDTATIAEEAPVTEIATPSTSSSAEIDVAVGLIESVLKENFENYTISHDDSIITVNVWEDGIAMGAVLAAAGNEQYKTSWDELVENQKGLCKSMCDFVDTLGLDDVMVMVNVLNDGNKDNVLLSIAEGIVIYDSVNSN